MSSVYFYEMLTEHTEAECDQDHLIIIISSHASTPDRTAYILGKSDENPLDVMIDDVKRLKQYGADVIAIPCNTAHYFYNELKKEVDIPIISKITKDKDKMLEFEIATTKIYSLNLPLEKQKELIKKEYNNQSKRGE